MTDGTDGPKDEVLRTERRPGVVELTLNRPAALNALTSTLVESLHEHLRTVAADPDCRAVVLTGAGRGFCAGINLSGYGTPHAGDDVGDVQRHWSVQRRIAQLVQEIRRLPQPVIAQVNGPAAGGGLALVCAADVRIAASSAVFATSFIRIGVTGCDIGTSWMLPRLVGAGRAHELMMTARRFDAAEALRIGLLADVVDGERLRARVDEMLDALLLAPPLSLSLTKQGMWLSLEIPSFDAAVELENRQQVLTAMTEDAGTAMASYLKRDGPPVYRNR